ncbi:MAG: 16S rRNA processing protein RimM [Fimbriimonadaceae bacterium]|nr:16S rRNA processing protein RimM [Fimbriimonadaceae bacterium]
MAEEHVRIGQVVGAFGLRGEMKVEPSTEFAERFEKGRHVRVGGDDFVIRGSRWHQGRVLLMVDGVANVDAAKARQWQYVEALASERPELDEDTVLLEDLLGREVRTEEGELLGRVDEILENPAHAVLVVGELMIPAVEAFVRDVSADRILVRLIPGMRDVPAEG